MKLKPTSTVHEISAAIVRVVIRKQDLPNASMRTNSWTS